MQSKGSTDTNYFFLIPNFNQADLASIYSEEENNFVSGLAEGKIAWLGGYRYQVCPSNPFTTTPPPPTGPGGPISSNTACQCYGCGFLWTDGTPMNYNATFAPGQPDNKVNLDNILLNL